MSRQIRLPITDLSPEAVAGFGAALMSVDAPPTSDGPWWNCWEGLAQLSDGRQWIGFVRVTAGWPDISEMEREPGTEIVIPVTGPIVQVVAPATSADRGRPDASRARALLIRPGSALVMEPGVWHAAAFGGDAAAAYFYVAERRKAEASEGRGGWVALDRGDTITCRSETPSGTQHKEPTDDR